MDVILPDAEEETYYLVTCRVSELYFFPLSLSPCCTSSAFGARPTSSLSIALVPRRRHGDRTCFPSRCLRQSYVSGAADNFSSFFYFPGHFSFRLHLDNRVLAQSGHCCFTWPWRLFLFFFFWFSSGKSSNYGTGRNTRDVRDRTTRTSKNGARDMRLATTWNVSGFTDITIFPRFYFCCFYFSFEQKKRLPGLWAMAEFQLEVVLWQIVRFKELLLSVAIVSLACVSSPGCRRFPLFFVLVFTSA